MREETREIMGLFVEKAKRVLNDPYLRYLQENGSRFHLSWVIENPVQFQHVTPDTAAVDSLAVTFRMFIQDNDRISLGNMAKVCNDPNVSLDWKDHFTFARSVINQYLDGIPYLDLRPEGVTLTGREIVDTFLYGEYVHTTKAKREKYLRWKTEPIMFALISFTFDKVVLDLLKTIGYISALCELEVEGKPILENPEMKNGWQPPIPLFRAELKPNTEGITAPVVMHGHNR